MPNQQINSITSATTTDGSELLPVVSGGVTKSVSVSTINSGIAADAVSDVYDARDLAVGQSSIAAAAALAAGSIAQQDLTAVSAALHRSPNAVTSMFVYDTTKDSDGGAWTEKCQHTSWYNESINGKWLGARASETHARNAGATLGAELLTNGTFDTDTTGWTAVNATLSAVGGALRVTKTAANGQARQGPITTVIGRVYRVTATLTNRSATAVQVFLTVGTAAGGTQYANQVVAVVGQLSNTVEVFFTATSTSAHVALYSPESTGFEEWDNISVREVTAVTTQTGDYFQLTTDGKFYKLNATSGITEVFRGNKRDFPRMAAIVADSARAYIYDLTEPGRPMWMVFGNSYTLADALGFLGGSSVSIGSAYGLNGKVLFGGTASNESAGLLTADFAKDSLRRVVALAAYGGEGLVVSQRNVSDARFPQRTTGQIASRTVNSVAMTVLPDAPVDPVTGLQVPTIAVATAGGVSIIKHNGTVASSAEVVNFSQVTLTPQILSVGGGSAGRTWRYVLNPGTVGSGFLVTGYVVQGDPSEWQRGAGVPLLKASSRSQMVRTNTAEAMLVFRKNQENAVSKAVHATITNTYNTGHMVGDIRRTYLADTSVGSVYSPALTMQNMITTAQQGVWYDPSDYSTLYQDAAGTTPVTAVEQPVGLMLDKSKGLVLGPELVTNGTFDTDASGWLAWGGVALNATSGWENGELKVSDSGVTQYRVYTPVVTTPGRTYFVTATARKVFGSGSAFLNASSNNSGSDGSMLSVYAQTSASSNTTLRIRFIATGNTSYIFVGSSYSTSGFTAYFDNISVRELPGNHAFNPSGNSANFPVLSARYNLLTKTEDFDDAVWTKSNTTITANAVTAPDGTTTAAGFVDNATNSLHQTLQSTAGVSGAYTTSVSVKAGFYNYALVQLATDGTTKRYGVVVDLNNGAVTATSSLGSPVSASNSVTSLGSGWYRITLNATNTSGNVQLTVSSVTSATPTLNGFGLQDYAGGSNTCFYIWGADLRVANDALNQPAYQRVNTSSDYDTVGFKPYLKFNGTNQWLQTNSIDFTATDKMFVSAGVRKLRTDSASEFILEYSTDSYSTNSSLSIQGSNPNYAPIGEYSVTSRGTAWIAVATTSTAYKAPVSNIVSAISSISAPNATLRVNGVQAATSAASQGTGNFGNYQLYIGARAGTSLWFNGRLYQLVIVNKIPTADELKSTETTINRKTLAYAE